MELGAELYRRLEWFHNRVTAGYYPNAYRLSEYFNISPGRAHRDVEFLRRKLKAPLVFDFSKNGFYYSESYTLPFAVRYESMNANTGQYDGVIEENAAAQPKISVVQFRIPYTAELSLKNKLSLLELRPYIVKRRANSNIYVCEYTDPDGFFRLLMSLDGDVGIISPESLRSKAVDYAKRIIKNNSPTE